MSHAIHAHDSPRSYATKERCEQLRLFILRYSTEHDGQTPTPDLMAREMGAPEAAISFMLSRLEHSGEIHVVSRKPLRVMVTTPGVDPMAGGPTERADPTRYDRFLDAEATRHKLGRFIGQHEQKTGRGPTLRQMMDHLQSNNASWVARAAEMLGERGIIQFGRDVPTKLTAFGRQFYGFEKGKPAAVPATPTPPAEEKIIVVPVQYVPPRPLTSDITQKVGEVIASWSGARPPKKNQIAAVLGHGRAYIYRVVDQMAEQGLVEPLAKCSKKGVRLTIKGRQTFNPVVEPPLTTVPVAPPVGAFYRKPEVAAPAVRDIPFDRELELLQIIERLVIERDQLRKLVKPV